MALHSGSLTFWWSRPSKVLGALSHILATAEGGLFLFQGFSNVALLPWDEKLQISNLGDLV